MRGISFFQKPSYREISPMRGRLMWGLPVWIYIRLFWYMYLPKVSKTIQNPKNNDKIVILQ